MRAKIGSANAHAFLKLFSSFVLNIKPLFLYKIFLKVYTNSNKVIQETAGFIIGSYLPTYFVGFVKIFYKNLLYAK